MIHYELTPAEDARRLQFARELYEMGRDALRRGCPSRATSDLRLAGAYAPDDPEIKRLAHIAAHYV